MRVATVSRILARAMGQSKTYCRTIYLAAPLHDAGKIGISDAILNKPSALTPAERKEIERHTEIGAQMLENGESDLITMAHEIALYHHEKWDGSGYGLGLKGEQIPLSARIVAVSDVLDALLAQRAYKPTWTFEDGYAEVLRQSGAHFDPDCVLALTASKDLVQATYQKTALKSKIA
ncbi:HD domain-containing protein [Yoonia sp.]|nr:HD domain-containing protein [Yoonia sp.]